MCKNFDVIINTLATIINQTKLRHVKILEKHKIESKPFLSLEKGVGWYFFIKGNLIAQNLKEDEVKETVWELA